MLRQVTSLSLFSFLFYQISYADMIDYYMMAILPSLSTYHYGTIISEETGKTWLDRNLGARSACTHSRNDFMSDEEYINAQESCFGFYYQWGRPTDGHQKASSSAAYMIASTITPGHATFILRDYTDTDWTTADDNGSQRQNSWNPCPVGFRIPTMQEFENENINSRSDAFTSLLLPDAGKRSYYDGDIDNKGAYGRYWSVTLKTTSPYQAAAFYIEDSTASTGYLNGFSDGMSVRCIEE